MTTIDSTNLLQPGALDARTSALYGRDASGSAAARGGTCERWENHGEQKHNMGKNESENCGKKSIKKNTYGKTCLNRFIILFPCQTKMWYLPLSTIAKTHPEMFSATLG